MDFVLYNLRLKELVAIVKENRMFFDEFVGFLHTHGYSSILEFIQEGSDEKAIATIAAYLASPTKANLYDGLLRPYSNSKAKWYFLAWLLRDAASQRLQPLLSSVPGKTDVERKSFLVNEIRKFVEPLFPDPENWEWSAISEVMLARLEGSRRALKGTVFEKIVRRNLRDLIQQLALPLTVSDSQVTINDETYDVEISGKGGALLIPVKTRETMGGGHAMLFTRDIYKSILVATEQGHKCVPVVIAESWSGDFDTLKSELYIYIQANPNQVTQIEPLLVEKLKDLIPLLNSIAA